MKAVVYYRARMKQKCDSMASQRTAAPRSTTRSSKNTSNRRLGNIRGTVRSWRRLLNTASVMVWFSCFLAWGGLCGMRVMADLVNAGVEFMACDNPLATKETASLLAETAAKEAEQIRQRTLNKMAQLKKAGVKLGSARPGHWKGHEDKRGWKKAVKASTRQRLQRTQDYYAFLVPEIKQMRDEGNVLTRRSWIRSTLPGIARRRAASSRRLPSTV